MDKKKLKAAVLGLKEGGVLLECAAESPYFDITAVAEKESEIAEQTTKQYQCEWFDDYRQLVMSGKVDCILVAAGLYSCEQHIRLAMEKGIHIFKLSPPGRNFSQAAELFRYADEKKVTYAVSAQSRYIESLTALSESIKEEAIQKFKLITADCSYGGSGRPVWHNDPELAGGGVLLRDCYEIVDFFVGTFGLPEQVYCLATNNAEDKQKRGALTEDTISVMMKYTDDLCGNLVARKIEGTNEGVRIINCYGKEKTLVLSGDVLQISDDNGEAKKKKKFSTGTELLLAGTLDNFALSIFEPQENKLICSANEHLKNMAVIEAAYLSSRTGMPEEPKRILEYSG
ncbi:MAG: Gfo/Idh/MocA family oxidoreductase [Sedimentisphaerales bacterium]|nr:Gfo/Idh/MocA family oxidoreductase [Sedimentisphaerales bacterium]